ncbi:MAG: tRNA epoxyqueuosine(34) reductase QueG [Muribaculaceae bacterium]|nr:tRNA epoxyqueuosine(34) reductase QueG [Muribaculaceae bacterium]
MDKEEIKEKLLGSGAVAVGFAESGMPDPEISMQMKEWVERGENAGMDYLKRHIPLKNDPEHILPGVKTVISIAFSFAPPFFRAPSLPVIASYAYGEDYHDVIRRKLEPIVESIKEIIGGEWRICIDSAPLPERYWAMKSGIGRLGRNGMVIIDGFGSYIFLSEILSTLPFPPDPPSDTRCMDCGKCIDACPQGALKKDNTIDCRRCLSYLTIEHKGEWTPEMKKAMDTSEAKNTFFGCERCLSVCPHNKEIPPTSVEEFYLRDAYSGLTVDFLKKNLSPDAKSTPGCFRNSPIRRARLQGLIRNVENIGQ